MATIFGKFQLRSEGSLSMLANLNDTTNAGRERGGTNGSLQFS